MNDEMAIYHEPQVNPDGKAFTGNRLAFLGTALFFLVLVAAVI